MESELRIAVNHEVFDVFVLALGDENIQQLLAVGLGLAILVEEDFSCKFFEIIGEKVGVLLEDLALIEQLDEAADFVFSEIQDVILGEFEVIDKEFYHFLSLFAF